MEFKDNMTEEDKFWAWASVGLVCAGLLFIAIDVFIN